MFYKNSDHAVHHAYIESDQIYDYLSKISDNYKVKMTVYYFYLQYIQLFFFRGVQVQKDKAQIHPYPFPSICLDLRGFV